MHQSKTYLCLVANPENRYGVNVNLAQFSNFVVHLLVEAKKCVN